MVSEIAAALTSLKAAGDIAKAMAELRDASAFQSKAIDLQREIISAQVSAIAANTAQSALVESKRALEEEVTRLKAWDGEKEKYELKAVYSGAFAYVLKPDASGTTPPHWLCTNCYENRRKSILQEQGRTPDRQQKIYACPNCKSAIRVHWKYSPEAPWAGTQGDAA